MSTTDDRVIEFKLDAYTILTLVALAKNWEDWGHIANMLNALADQASTISDRLYE